MRNYFIILLVALTNTFVWGQELPKVIPPTPEATQLAKFVDMPVSLYNGTPNISVPIYTISAGGIQIPISLSYHAKGIQVSEIASRTGLGWSLNAGGVITRQIRGIADNNTKGYLQENYIEDFQTNAELRTEIMSLDWFNNGSSFDYYPDVFMFNFMGYSGKFIFDQITKMPILQKYDDLKINVIGGDAHNLVGFTIITPDGTTFVFSETENSISYNDRYNDNSLGLEEVSNSGLEVNSWYLSTIITNSNETITFTYGDETVTSYEITEVSDYPTNRYLDYCQRISYQKQIQQISFNSGKLVFNASNIEREDLAGGKALDNIEVYAKTSPMNFSLKKKFKLNYFYTTSNNENPYTVLNFLTTTSTQLKSKKRLFLEWIDEIDVDDPTNHIRTSFEYNPIVLPNRLSNSKDSWGYYNGKPNHFMNVYQNTDRTVDITLSEAGMLKKISYPTGGSTEFEYEQNKVIPPTYFKNLLIPFNNPLGNRFVGLIKSDSLYNPSSNSYNKSFEIKNRPTSVNFNVNFDGANCQMGGPVESTCRYRVFILDSSGYILDELTLGANNVVWLYPGNYSIKVKPNHGAHHPYVDPQNPNFYEEEAFMVVGTWQEQDIPDDQELLAAGKRIRKIIKKDNGIIQLEKEYFYTDQNGKCSGIPFSIPPYFDIISQVIPGANFVGRQLSGPAGPICEFAGNNLGYSMVTEVQNGANGPLGKTEYTFTVYNDTSEYYKFPYHIPVDFEWSRGMPLETRYYKYNDNNTYSIIKKNINVYNFYENCMHPAGFMYQCLENPDSPSTNPTSSDYFVNSNRFRIPSYKFGKYYTGLGVPCFAGVEDTECYRTTYFVGGKLNLNYSETFDYFDSGESVYNRTTYLYDSEDHYQKTAEITRTSIDGVNLKTMYYYAPEMNNAAMVNKNMVGIPLKTETYRGDERLSVTETVYKDWGNDLLAPELIKVAKGDDTPQTRVRYNLVDNRNGNPLELQQLRGTVISYLWGYNKTQPIAKIENASNLEIAAALMVSDLDSITEDDMVAINNLRSLLPNAMISTYTYIPMRGVETITDPKGDTIRYKYDAFGRLEAVYDSKNHKLSENQYHYRTQN